MGKIGMIYSMMKTTFLGKRETPQNMKTELNNDVMRPRMIYSRESWTLSKKHIIGINAMKIRFLGEDRG